MTVSLDDLLTDWRLARLFLTPSKPCALQLWILQIQCDRPVGNRVIYGRLIPYSYSDRKWSCSNEKKFSPLGTYEGLGKVQAIITQFNVYLDSCLCAEFLRLLCTGESLLSISKKLCLEIPDGLHERFEATVIDTSKLFYRPVACLLNRSAFEQRAISSPHGDGSAFSASIVQADKGQLVCLEGAPNAPLTEMVIAQLNTDTGLDFGTRDIQRLGDIELLVFPTLDKYERELLRMSWEDSPYAFIARLTPSQLPDFNSFQFHLNIVNNGQIIDSQLAPAAQDESGDFVCKFELKTQFQGLIDQIELEIFGFCEGSSRGTLCCRWGVRLIREMNFQIRVVGHSGKVRFSWLERTLSKSSATSARAEAVLTTPSADTVRWNIGGRKADPWVAVNQDLYSFVSQLHPPKSKGLFLLRWGKGDSESRLKLAEWFKKLFGQYPRHQIIIFDPYFEDAGFGLVLLSAENNSECIVFRSLGKGEHDTLRGINNLVMNCKQNRSQLRRIRFRVYGLKQGRLHDRYILISGSHGESVAGFHLSNSFQNAAENYPLLITPIPADTLREVDEYMRELVREADSQVNEDTGNPSMRVLFDSRNLGAESLLERKRSDPLSFLEYCRGGDVLSRWIKDSSLKGLSGQALRQRMEEIGILKDTLIAISSWEGVYDFIGDETLRPTEFKELWEFVCEVVAHSEIERYDPKCQNLEIKDKKLETALAQFLQEAFSRDYDGPEQEISGVDLSVFQRSVDSLLSISLPQISHLLRSSRYLTRAEYYTIKILWRFAPSTLLSIAERQLSQSAEKDDGFSFLQACLLNQIICEISTSVQLDIAPAQREALLESDSGFLRWLGLNAIKSQLEDSNQRETVLPLIDTLDYSDQIRFLGWMIRSLARNHQKTSLYKELVGALHVILPEKISDEDLIDLVNSVRGLNVRELNQLAWSEPWLYRDIIAPLLESNCTNCDAVCDIWMKELFSMPQPEKSSSPSLSFSRMREGHTMNVAAFLFAKSSLKRQQDNLNLLKDILKRQQRILWPPLSSCKNWEKWNVALLVSMRLLVFCRLVKFYLPNACRANADLNQVAVSAHELAMRRPMEEWRSKPNSELAAFLEEVEKLIAERN